MEEGVLCSGDVIPSELGVSSDPSTNTFRGTLDWYLINCSPTGFFWSIKGNIFWQEEHRSNRLVKLNVVSFKPYFCHHVYQGACCYTFPREGSRCPSRQRECLCQQPAAHELCDCPTELVWVKGGTQHARGNFCLLPLCLGSKHN